MPLATETIGVLSCGALSFAAGFYYQTRKTNGIHCVPFAFVTSTLSLCFAVLQSSSATLAWKAFFIATTLVGASAGMGVYATRQYFEITSVPFRVVLRACLTAPLLQIREFAEVMRVVVPRKVDETFERLGIERRAARSDASDASVRPADTHE